MTPALTDIDTLAASRRLRVVAFVSLAAGLAALGWLARRDLAPDTLFHPHGYCYLWEPSLVAAHVGADSIIGLSYLAISLTLTYLVARARRQIPFSWMFLLFGAFIVACGSTHLMEVVTLWYPLFWTAADLKIVTAVASIGAALALPPLVPRVLTLLDSARLSEARRIALEEANRTLEARVAERTAELEALSARDNALRIQAEMASRSKDEFLAIVSHELRTPLNAILGWGSMLSREQFRPEDRQRAAASIVRNARTQARLVDDLLDVSRIVSGKLRVTLEPLAVQPAIALAIETISPAANVKRLTITFRQPADRNVQVSADPQRFQQMLWNLLANAVKFTPEGGQIQVTLTADDNRVHIAVEDNGSGIAAAFLPHVFERFTQADTAASRAHGGLGLGLALVRHLIELHGGSVAVSSAGIGRGSRFTLDLPRLTTALPIGRQVAAAPDVTPDLRDRRVLVVDDDPEALDVLEVGLTELGATVLLAPDADRARTRIAADAPDVLVTDLAMPAEDGLTLVRRLRQDGHTLPAILMTAHVRRGDELNVDATGFQALLHKPVTPLELARVISDVSRQRPRR